MENKYATSNNKHYYGDIVRALFLLGALIMLMGLPAINNYLSVPTILSVIGVLILGLAAGITNPRQVWDAAINTAIAAAAFVVFESSAVNAFQNHGGSDKFFVANLGLGLIFLFATYFSVKTLRGALLKEKSNNPKV